MDSASESSFYNHSDTQETEDSVSGRTRSSRIGKAQELWRVHTVLGVDPKLHYCRYCEPGSYATATTTNMRFHLKSAHQIIDTPTLNATRTTATANLQQLYSQMEISDETEELERTILKKYLQQDVIDEALVSLIVVRNIPFTSAEWPEFHTFCQALNPEVTTLITTTHSQIAMKIETSYTSSKDTVRRILQSAISHIHIALDGWTAPNQQLLLGVVAHFTDHQYVRRKALLGLKPLASHVGAEQATVLLDILQDYGIVSRLGAIMGDNASTNDTLCASIHKRLDEEQEIEWDNTKWRVRCTGHIINLAIKAFLFQDIVQIDDLEPYDKAEHGGSKEDMAEIVRENFRLLGPLGQLHNIIVHSRASSYRIARIEYYIGRRVPMDNSTRWNSWHTMVIVSLQHSSGIDSYVKEFYEDLSKDYLTPEHWQRLRTIEIFLAPFHKATLQTQGDSATLDQVLLVMDNLRKWYERSRIEHEEDADFVYRIDKSWEIFDKYYSHTDATPLYAAALILNPKNRTKYIERHWPKKWHKNIFKKVKQLWEDYRDNQDFVPIFTSTSNENPEKKKWKRKGKEKQKLDAFDEIAQDLQVYNRPSSSDEWEDYCSEAPYDITGSALEWWSQRTQKTRWPRLSHMAIDILSIPAMMLRFNT